VEYRFTRPVFERIEIDNRIMVGIPVFELGVHDLAHFA
jgi:hypothetical protein